MMKWGDLALKYGQYKLSSAEQERRNRVTQAEYGEPGTDPTKSLAGRRISAYERSVGVGEERNRIDRDTLNLSTPEFNKNFSMKHVIDLESNFAAQDELMGDKAGKGVVTECFKPITGFANLLARNKDINKGFAYMMMSQSAENLKTAVVKNLSEAYKKALENQDTMKAEGLGKILNAMDDAPAQALVNQAFPKTALEIQMAMEKNRKTQTLGKLGKLLTERESLPEGSALRPDYDKAILKETTPTEKETKLDKELKAIKSSYEKAIGRANSAKMGVNILSESMGEEKGEVSAQEYKKAYNLALQYKEKGGDIGNIGLTPESVITAYVNNFIKEKDLMKFGITAENIRDAFNAGTLTEDVAKRLLMENY